MRRGYRGYVGIYWYTTEHSGIMHHQQAYRGPLPGDTEIPSDKGEKVAVGTSGALDIGSTGGERGRMSRRGHMNRRF